MSRTASKGKIIVHPDLDALLEVLLPHAKRMLTENGEFFPFSSSMNKNGDIASVSVYVFQGEQPSSEQMVKFMTQGFKDQAAEGEIRAAGFCVDVRVTPPGETEETDAVSISLEHESGEAFDVFVPYKKMADNEFQYGALTVSQRRGIF